jgi:hypothetical protein
MRQHGDGESADARPNLEDHVLLAQLRQVEDAPYDGVVHQEVLPKAVLCVEAESVQDLTRPGRIGKP